MIRTEFARSAFYFMNVLLAFVASVRADEVKKSETVMPIDRPEAAWNQRHERMNERVKQGNVELIFIGDSITQGWEGAGKQAWGKYYAKRNAVNLGIGGDRTQHVLWRLENGNIEGINPKLAVVMIGTNNSASNTPEEIAAGITAIVDRLKSKLPESKILLLGVFPRGEEPSDRLRQINARTNVLIEKLDDAKTVFYLDIGAKFLDKNGTLTKDVMPDFLHLSPAGYSTWAAAIEPKVKELMGENE